MRNAIKIPGSRSDNRLVTDDFGNKAIFRRCNKCGLFKEWDSGFHRPSYATCRTCKNAYTAQYKEQHRDRINARKREHYRAIRNDPDLWAYYMSRRDNSYRKRPKEQTQRAYQKFYAKLKADPERYQRYLENRRIYYSGYRERQGVKPRKTVPQTVHNLPVRPKKGRETYLPREPFVGWLDSVLPDYGGEYSQLAIRLGCSEKHIRRQRKGDTIRASLADFFITGEGKYSLADIYPEYLLDEAA